MEKWKKPEEILYGSENEQITNWRSIKIKETEMILYYNFHDKKEKYHDGGFEFYCIKAITWKTKHLRKKPSFKRTLNCECVFRGMAFFDGIRHLYYGDKQTDNYGYFFYLVIENLILALKELRKLELKYCRDVE